jgi:hypothetical protein
MLAWYPAGYPAAMDNRRRGVGENGLQENSHILSLPSVEAGMLFFAHSSFAFSINDSLCLYSAWACASFT